MPAPFAAAPSSRGRDLLTRSLPWITSSLVFVQLLSLRLGLLDRFFFDTLHADVQGIDFYSLPKAWLNLAAGRSLYATFDPPTYGAHFTWYLAHPLLAAVLGWPLSRLAPTESYGAFTFFSLAVMAVAAFLLALESRDPLVRRLIWLLMLGSFPGFLMLFVGNVQPLTVLALSLLLVGMLRLQHESLHATRYVFAGLLVSLFTKPVVLLLLPLLLLLRETRRTALRALAWYLLVSFLFEIVPLLNPEPIGLRRVLWLAVHPAFVRRTMDIYANHFLLTPDMRDNSVHWSNLVAQSGSRLSHIDVYSLPVFLDTVIKTHTPDWLCMLPAVAVLALSIAVWRIRDDQVRCEAALLLACAASLSFFVAYPTVWEYQYTAVLPVAATLLLSRHASPLRGRRWAWSVGLAVCAWLPSLYFLDGSALPTARALTLARLDRVIPVTLLFGLLLFAVATAALPPTKGFQANQQRA